MNNIFIGLSWPYANGELHIGHLGSSLPADILARFYRLKGYNVCFVSGSDCFGTPISIQAQKENKSPKEITNYYHEKFVQIFNDLNLSFDCYTKTTNKQHIDFARDFHKNLYSTKFVEKKLENRLYCNECKRFLPDRYVIGLCPKCGSTSKGDACEKCGTILEPEELKEPHCGICNCPPIFKETYQYYLKLSKLQPPLIEYFNNTNSTWTQNAINLTNRYFNDGLLDRAISRDLDWGVSIPTNEPNKVIYNWGENVLGYLSACENYCINNNQNLADWFQNNNTKHIYVHAKDNIQFHSIIFPALLLANTNHYNLPNSIFAYEFVTNEGQKISKSKGTCLTARELLEKYDVDFLRFYFAKNISDKKDLDYRHKDFVNCVNGELINNWGNLVNRVLSFIRSKFDGTISKFSVCHEIKVRINTTYENVSNYIEKGKISNALREILDLVDYSNKYFNTTEPWNVIKTDKKQCEQLCYEYLTLISNITILLNPFIPNGTSKVANWIGIKIESYNYCEPNNIILKEFQPLYIRIID